MATWTAEIAVRPMGKSYTLPALFVTVHAGTWYAAMGAAAREGHERLSTVRSRTRVEMVSIKLTRVEESTDNPKDSKE